MFARKDLETLLAEMAGEHRLRRVLGPVSLTSLGVGCIIGAGIFVMTGMAAADDGGPAIMISFAVAAFGCALAALCYAEFAAMAPVAGSVYTYAYTTLGEIFAWIIGWDLILEYSMGCADRGLGLVGLLERVPGSARAAAGLARALLRSVHSGGRHGRPAWFNLPAVLIMVAVTVVLVMGIRESARTNAVLVIIKVAVVLFVIAVGIGYVDSRNWTEVPVTERVLPQERVLPGLVKEYLLSSGSLAADPCSPEFRLRQQTLERQLAASYRLTWVRQENERLLQAGRLSREEAESRYREIEAKVGRTCRRRPTRPIVERLLPQVRSRGPEEGGPLVGPAGPDRPEPLAGADRRRHPQPVHALRPVGDHAGGGDRVLRLHRLRFDLDARRGSAAAAARRAHRHPRVADPLHGAVHRRGGGDHRHGAVSGDRRACAHRGGVCRQGGGDAAARCCARRRA